MILAIDIGNTNITIGGYNRNGSLILTSRIATDSRRTADQYAVEIYDVFACTVQPWPRCRAAPLARLCRLLVRR